MPEFLAAVGIGDYLLVAVVTFFAAALAAVTGYGAGVILPLVLVPVIGAEVTVPVMGFASLLMNAGRLAAFWRHFDRRSAAIIIAAGIPFTIFGSYAYTLLTGKGASVVIGLALMVIVPLRRIITKFRGHLSVRSVAVAGAGFGFVDGGAPGVGVVLISILLAAGLQGSAVIATDAGISLVLAAVKTTVFQASGLLAPSAWLMATVIGAVALPAAFVGRWVVPRIPPGIHIWILDGVVLIGGAILVVRGLR